MDAVVQPNLMRADVADRLSALFPDDETGSWLRFRDSYRQTRFHPLRPESSAIWISFAT